MLIDSMSFVLFQLCCAMSMMKQIILPGILTEALIAQTTISYYYTGDVQQIAIPSGFTSMKIDAYGAGFSSTTSGFTCQGGKGAYAYASFDISSDKSYFVYIGGMPSSVTGGYNGGGQGSSSSSTGGYGATDVRTSADVSSRIIVAGGGGGCVKYNSCAASGGDAALTGSNGAYCSTITTGGGGGATQIAAGTAGYKVGSTKAESGSSSSGGKACSYAGGGGGGGYFGGGGGCNGGGGGGSSFVPTNGTVQGGFWGGNGQCIITFYNPTASPSVIPSIQPARLSSKTTETPSRRPTNSPKPTLGPSGGPSTIPSDSPSEVPTFTPSDVPTEYPSDIPTQIPSETPSDYPSEEPSFAPSTIPTGGPTTRPSVTPTLRPSCGPSVSPSKSPSMKPSALPSGDPSLLPTTKPTFVPSMMPSVTPTISPTKEPSMSPSELPSNIPTYGPSLMPSCFPTTNPSCLPSALPTPNPTCKPTIMPTVCPSVYPTSALPSKTPTSFSPTLMALGLSQTYSYTGQMKNVSVPAGVKYMSVKVYGAGGNSKRCSGGYGAVVWGTFNVTPGQKVYINVGGASDGYWGGYNGGGRCYGNTFYCSGGNGATDIRLGNSSLSSRVIVAGGGGGYGYCVSCDKGGNSSEYGLDGSSGCYNGGGSGATKNYGGNASYYYSSNNDASSGTLAYGGSGCSYTGGGGGGGGGGYYGGGGGCFGGGGGGSSLIPAIGAVIGTNSGNGKCILTFSMSPTPNPSAYPTTAPTLKPSYYPTLIPSSQPSTVPTVAPSLLPSCCPSISPTVLPSIGPTIAPSNVPSQTPTFLPSLIPSLKPTTMSPSLHPSSFPSIDPSASPSVSPTMFPSPNPSTTPSQTPSQFPSIIPTVPPSRAPSTKPTPLPSKAPSVIPTKTPTVSPSYRPSCTPSVRPSVRPTTIPSLQPSVSPSLEPSETPSVAPSEIPSQCPSDCPSRIPTELPTCWPSGDPSTLPSALPSAVPTEIPTLLPSLIPTIVPSTLPSDLPTPAPCQIPSSFPSVAPTAFPTTFPSESPTTDPSESPSCPSSKNPSVSPYVSPSVSPTDSPSTEPSWDPSETPTDSTTQTPSHCPTTSPSVSPTDFPYQEPTVPPSYKPTAALSATPSDNPTCSPSFLPSRIPSFRPSQLPSPCPTTESSTESSLNATQRPSVTTSTSFSPSGPPTCRTTGVPSTVPSVLPSTGPSVDSTFVPNPSIVPSVIATSEPSKYPFMLPSLVPTTHPSGEPSVLPSQLPSKIPSVTPSGYPSLYPSVCPSLSPSVQPIQQPSVAPSFVPSSLSPTMLPSVFIDVAPEFFSMSVSVSKSSLTVISSLSGGGSVYCRVYQSSLIYAPSTVDEIISQNAVASTDSADTATVLIDGLSAATNYSVYCLSVSKVGTVMSLSKMLATKQYAVTSCCNSVTVSLSTNVIVENTAVTNLLSVALSSVPARSLSVSISCHLNTSTSESQLVYPNSFSFTSISSFLTGQSSVYSLPTGVYTFSASLSGASASQYSVEYASGTTFTVVRANQTPPAPRLSSAVFASDGSYLTISFDSSTNKGGLTDGSFFSCMVLFDFACSGASSCQWTDSSTVRALITESVEGSCVVPGSTVKLARSASIRAACPAASDCSRWSNSSVSSSVSIQSPAMAVTPVVVVSAPGVIGSCDSLTLDLTSSSGSGGRQWTSRSISVESNELGGGNSTAIIENFLSTHYVLSPPTPVPNKLFSVGVTYYFTVTVCNFLGKCSSSGTKVTVLGNILPSVSLPGQSVRTVTRNTALNIVSSSFMASCSGGVSSSVGLTYQWSVSENGVVNVNTVTTSKDPSKMLLPVYSLSLNSVYQMQLTVTHTPSMQSSSASTTVVVVSGSVMAVISGGSSVSVRVGGSVIVDASSSYAEDVQGLTGSSAGLVFAWSCYQSAPTYSSSCSALFVSSWSGSKVQLAAQAQTLSGTTSGVVSVVVSDASQKRSSTASVSVTVLPGFAPVLSLQSNQASGVMNPGQMLQLSGTVSLPVNVSGNATWSVVDSSFDLSSVALSPVMSRIAASTSDASHSVFMAIASNSLPVGTSMTFKLTCSTPVTSASAMMAITINAPPQLGSFSVGPRSGVALTQLFTFAASQWVDSNLPVTYQFGFYSNSGTYIVVKSQSLVSYVSTFLSAGLDANGHNVTCGAQVFDSLNAYSSASYSVTVRPGVAMNSSAMAAYVMKSLSAGLTNTDSIKQALALSSSVLNTVDCSDAGDCATLNRQQCYKTVNTCGACNAPYVGVSGDSNSACVMSIMRDGGSDGVCGVASDCRNAFAECVEGHCVVPNKQCTNDCSGHGECVFVSKSNTSVAVSSCSIVDGDCSAVCRCEVEYALSAACDLTNAEVEASQASKDLVLSTLGALMNLEDPSEQVVSGWANSISIATQSTDQMSVAGTSSALGIVSAVLGTASELSVSLDAVGGLLVSMDSITSAVAVQISSNRTSSANSTVAQIQDILQAYTAHATSMVLPGMPAVSSSYDLFQLSTQYLSASATMSLPVSTLDVLSGSQGSSVSLPADSSVNVAVSMVSLHSDLYADSSVSGGFVSNPVSVMLSTLPCASAPCEVIIVLQSSIVLSLEHDVEEFNTTCFKDKPESFDHECRNGAVVPNINCSGHSYYVIQNRCPSVETSQVCNSLNGYSSVSSASGCRVVSHSNSEVTCACQFGAASSRRLSAGNDSDGSYSASYVAMLSSTAHTFTSTVLSAGSLSNSDAKKGRKAILTIGVFGCFTVLAIMLSQYADQSDKAKKDVEDLVKDKKKLATASRWKIEPMKLNRQSPRKAAEASAVTKVVDQEMALVEQSLPSVLNTSQTFSGRFKAEVKRHHRWFGVIFFYSDSFPRVFRVASLATNIIIMLFIQSITYNLTNPDDGSCGALSGTSVTKCQGPKSSFSTGQHKCAWNNDTEVCSFVEPDSSIKIELFVSIFSTILSAPIALMVDWILQKMISPPVDTSTVYHHQVAVASVHQTSVNDGVRPAEGTNISSRTRRINRTTVGMDERVTNAMIVSSAHAELTELAGEIRNYRDQLTTQQKHEFDVIWGLDENGCFLVGTERSHNALIRFGNFCMNVILGKKSDVASVHSSVIADLKNIMKQTETEVESFNVKIGDVNQVMSKETQRALGRRLLFLFQCDLLPGISGQILSSKGSRDYVAVKPVSLLTKVLGWSTVVVLNGGMLFYILLFALEQTKYRQSAWFHSFVLWLVVEILFVSTALVVVTHILIPMFAMKDVTKIKQRLLDNIREFKRNLGKHNTNVEETDIIKPFNAAKYLFVSSRVSSHFPEVREAQIISQFSTPWPRQSYLHYDDVSKDYNRRFSALSRSASILVVFFLTNLLNITPTMQDIVIHMISSAAIGYTILLHIELFEVFPVLVIVPLLAVSALVYPWVQWGKATARMRMAKLKPSPINAMKEPNKSNWSATSEEISQQHKPRGDHIGRRQSVIQGVQLLNEMKVTHNQSWEAVLYNNSETGAVGDGRLYESNRECAECEASDGSSVVISAESWMIEVELDDDDFDVDVREDDKWNPSHMEQLHLTVDDRSVDEISLSAYTVDDFDEDSNQ